MKIDITQEELQACRAHLSEMVLLAPAGSAQAAALAERRDRITGKIQELIERRFEPTPGLAGKIAELEVEVTRLRRVEKTLASIQQAITVADKVLEIAGSIVALAG